MIKKIAFMLTIIYLSLFAQGLNDGVLGVAWPSIRYEMDFPLEYAGFLIVTAFTMYSITASLVSRLYKFFKSQTIALMGILLIVTGNVGFFLAPAFFVLIIMIGVSASGQAFIEASLSAYLAKHFSARYMNWGLCFWGMGASVSPLIMAQMIMLFSWRIGYLVLLSVQLSIAVFSIIGLKKGVWVKEGTEHRKKKKVSNAKVKLSYQISQMSVFFIFSGTQTALGFWVTTVMLESRGLSIDAAGLYPAFYFGFIMLGRLFFGSVASRYSNMRLMRAGFFMAFLGLVLLMFTTNVFAIILIGFGVAPIFPCLIHETTRRFDPNVVEKQMGFQLSAAGFGDIISSSMGFVLTFIFLEALFPIAFLLFAIAFIINESIELRVKNS
ncbi:MAG: MFS transporter [Defluviitaleaceae bacterium]|nr:MFS transporter [Defluviitaleaceae bacterium]